MRLVDWLRWQGIGRSSDSAYITIGDHREVSGRVSTRHSTQLTGDLAHSTMELVPRCVNQNPCAHWRSPRDMMHQGWLANLFHA